MTNEELDNQVKAKLQAGIANKPAPVWNLNITILVVLQFQLNLINQCLFGFIVSS